MTTEFDPYDDEANLRRAQQEWIEEQIQIRLEHFLNRRPPAFDVDGELAPGISAWVDRVARATRTGRPGSLVLLGGTGTGKTWSLWKAGETLMRSGWRGLFEVVASYDLKRATMPPLDDDKITRWENADVLAVDDIGAQRVSDWDTDNLHALIDKRWQYLRPTIITSNDPDLRPILGERVASRLVDAATVVRFDGADRRRSR